MIIDIINKGCMPCFGSIKNSLGSSYRIRFLTCIHHRRIYCLWCMWTAISLIWAQLCVICYTYSYHDDVIKWKHFPPYWPFVRVIHRSPVNYPHKGQWREALMFSMICACLNGWVNNREAGDLRRHLAYYDVIVMLLLCRNQSPVFYVK